MHQRKYTLELISELGLGAAKPAVTPIKANIKLTTKEYDEHTSNSSATDDKVLTDISQYQILLEKLLYLTVTRPDIVYSIQTLSQFMQKPKRSHLEVAQRVVRYAKNQPGQGIHIVIYGDSLISWKSKKQSTISRSSAESEYRSIASTVAALVWILGLFKDIGIEVGLPVNIYTDSKSAIQIASNSMFHE
uniref:Uncharacterized mitochondrial protein AtMg00810-like n=1 Tax=Nicotiana tabacum TaxID=4097 RepID=A0A1S3YFG0_TOBAC|nr:PREDICTED: uncharacterized mitochondrial protein AtMg00810-like [Nicotiana tabacum]